MDTFKYIVLLILLINYARVISNILKNAYKNDFRSLIVDLLASYYLAPMVTIAIIWNYSDRIKSKHKIK